MANTIVTHATIAKESVAFLAATTPLLKAVSREGEREFGVMTNGSNKGDTINIRVPALGTVGSTADITALSGDVVEKTVPLKLDILKNVRMSLTSKERTFDANDFQKSKPAQYVAQLGTAVQDTMFDRMLGSVNGSIVVGADSKVSLLGARALINGKYAPAGNRSVLVGASASAEVTGDMVAQFTTKESEYTDGFIGQAFGAKFFEAANTATTKFVIAGTPAVSGSHAAATNTLKVSSTAGDVFGKGTTFTIAGMFAVDAMTGAATTKLQQYVVTSSVTATGAATDLVVFPAFGTVKPAASAAISFVGVSGTTYEVGFMLHKEAVRVAFGDLEVASDKKGSTAKGDGYSLRIMEGSDILTDVNTTRLDCLGGIAVVRPEWAVKLMFAI